MQRSRLKAAALSAALSLTLVCGGAPAFAEKHGCAGALTRLGRGPAVASAKEVLGRQTHSYGQEVLRNLSKYIELGNIGVVLRNGRVSPDFHWVDVGGGAGVAAIQSFVFEDAEDLGHRQRYPGWEITGRHRATVISFEDLFQSTFLNDMVGLPGNLAITHGFIERAREQLVARGQFKYLTGRLFEDIPPGEIGQADLITDIFGAFSYSANKFEILERMVRLLKPGGRISIYTLRPVIETRDPRGHVLAETLSFYLQTHPIPGVTMTGQWLSVRPEEGTLQGIIDLKERLTFDHAEHEVLPYRFYYRAKP